MEGIEPVAERSFDELYRLVEQKKYDETVPMNPMTLEGCVVKLCDTVSYIGRDLEDAVRLGLIRRKDLPESVTGVLGNTNGRIVYRLVENMIENSLERNRLVYDSAVGRALGELKRFNYEQIYRNPKIVGGEEKIRGIFRLLYERLIGDLEAGRPNSPIQGFLRDLDAAYLNSSSDAEKVRDYIAGMTDDYFIYTFKRLFVPEKLPREFQ